MESDWTWSIGHGLAGGHSHNDVLGQRNSLGTFRLLVQPCNLYMCACSSSNVAEHFSNLKKSHCYQCAGNLHWFHLVSKLPQHHTTWPSGWGWSPGHIDCGDHRHRGNSRSDDIWWHPPSSVWFSRVGLELFIRSPHGPIGLDLSMFCGIMKQFVEKNLESWWKFNMKFRKRPDGMRNASSSINTCNHQKSREKNPHIPAHPKLQFPQIALENTILLTGPHGFVSFPTGSSGGLQSFLLIRELILERRPQPVNTPEPMEPIEPTEGGEDLQEGWSLGEAETRGFWDFRIKGKSQNWSLTLLCLEVGVWNILGKDNWIAEDFTTKICEYLLLFVFVCINLISTQILQFRFVPNECVSENWWHQIQRAQNSCQFRTPNILNSELCERTAKWAKVENPNLAAKRSIVPTNVLGDFLHLYRTARLPSKQIAWAPVGAHFWNVLNCLSVNVVSTVNSQLHKLLLYKKNTHSNCRMSFGCLCVFEKALSPRHPDRSSEIHLELASD